MQRMMKSTVVLCTFFILCTLLISVLCSIDEPQEPHYKQGQHNDAFHDDESIEEFIDRVIAENDVMIFSKTYCPYCKRTKELFKREKIEANVFELDQAARGSEIQQALHKKTGQRTVPNVFIKGTHIGGSDATLAAHEKGEIAKLLK